MPSATVAPVRTGAVAARLTLVGYLLFVGFTVWLPASVSSKVTGLVGVIARWVADAGIASYYSSAVVLEFLANVALFVPIGLLLPLAWSRLRLWQVVLIGLLMSGLIESVQGFMPSRFPTISDVIANSLGALVGGMIVVLARLALAGRPARSPRLVA